MKIYKHQIFIILASIGIGLYLAHMLNARKLETWAVIFTLYSLGTFVHSLGREINFKQLIVLIASLQYLLMPVVTYALFDQRSELGTLWQTFMVVDSDTYFSLALPGTILLWLGFQIPFKGKYSDASLMERASESLVGRELIGYILICVGLIAELVINFLPAIMAGTVYYFTQLTYIGVLYLMLGQLRTKNLILVGVVILLVSNSIMTGMYGVLIFWSVLGVIMLTIGVFELSLHRKYGLMVMGVFLILLIQSVKHEYRAKVWDVGVRNNDPALWFGLVKDRIFNPESMIAPERLYKMTVRGNQGQIIGRTMKYVPRYEPFAKGETLIESVWASIVPRFFWPNKPRSGGKEKTCRFMGECGDRDYAFNLGQLGEAYVNFGSKGGAVVMFFYGLLINYLMSIVRRKSISRPTLILWAPLFFYSFLSLETDFLTSLNTFVKGVLFYLFLRYFLMVVFKIKI